MFTWKGIKKKKGVFLEGLPFHKLSSLGDQPLVQCQILRPSAVIAGESCGQADARYAVLCAEGEPLFFFFRRPRLWCPYRNGMFQMRKLLQLINVLYSAWWATKMTKDEWNLYIWTCTQISQACSKISLDVVLQCFQLCTSWWLDSLTYFTVLIIFFVRNQENLL